MNYTFMKKQIINDIGKRIGLNDIIEFVKKNKNIIKNIGCVDLNEKIDIEPKKIDKLKFQNFKKINYLPKNLTDIFTSNSENLNMYLHAGSLEKIKYSTHKSIEKKEINISFYSSILCCLNQSFLSQSLFHQSNFITCFINRLCLEASDSKFKQFEYKNLGWDKNELVNNIANGEIDENIIKYLSDYFHINIFILNLEEDKLYFGGGENYIPYKETIFLLKYNDDNYEPFFTEKTRTFSFSDPIIKTIKKFSNKIGIYVISDKMNLMFGETEENLDKYIHKSKTRKLKKYVQVETNCNNDINAFDECPSEDDVENSEIENITEQQITKKTSSESTSNEHIDPNSISISMKVDELRKIAKKLNIDIMINDKLKTKPTLIKEIKNKIKK